MRFFPSTKKKSILLGATLFVLVTATAFSMNIKSSKALLGIGGQIIFVIPCVDEGGSAIVVGTPTPGVYLWSPATVMFRYYELFTPGPWVLGGYVPTPGLTCSNDGVPVAFPIGIIEEVGTSMLPL